MEAEYQKLKPAPSFKHVIESTPVSREGSESELPRYTSLKDVMANSSPRDGPNNNDPINIAIRNELVKHAASAYLLSATVNPANKNRDWIPGLWERIKTSCLGFQSCWQMHVGLMPVEALCRPVAELFYHVVRRVRNGLRGKVEVLS